MYYINSNDVNLINRNWSELADVIDKAIQCLHTQEFAQPIKPYLRYKNQKNRIIAMPAYVGGEINYSGIKWIASFPENIQKGIKRAHSVSILNEADSGIPLCTINTPIISGIRTAAVTALMLKKYLELKPKKNKFVVGMTGFGPIGQLHLEMAADLLGDKLDVFKIFDLRTIDEKLIPSKIKNEVIITDSYHEAFEDVDIFITATVSSKPYLNQKPKPGSLHLNISLRDYESVFKRYVDHMIVDDWEEVCREETDIEMMHVNENLNKGDTLNLVDVFSKNALDSVASDDVIMFNPMGMAIFDIAIGSYYYNEAKSKQVGVLLED